MTIAPDTLRGGGSAMGTVKLSAPAPAGGAEVHLRSRTPDVFVRASVVVPGGQTSAAFSVQTLPRAATVSASVGALLGDSAQWAQLTVQPVPAPYFVPGRAQIAVFRPATAEWLLRSDDGSTVSVQWGASGDIPVPGDYRGLSRAQIAVYRK